MKKIFSVSYNAYSFEDVEKILLDLQNGIDPLKEKRLKLKEKGKNQKKKNNWKKKKKEKRKRKRKKDKRKKTRNFKRWVWLGNRNSPSNDK